MIKRLVSVLYSDFHPWDTKWTEKEGVQQHVSTNPNELKEGDLLIVHGGADISPSLYNRKVSRHTGADDRPSKRDIIEWDMMRQAVKLKIPIVGICRGAQMLCALAGGHLIQHVNGHAGWKHAVITVDGEEFDVNSIHHQMMYPFDVKHEMLAWSKHKLSDVYFDVNEKVEVPIEPEMVYFPEVLGFAVQHHPEMMSAFEPATQFIFKQLEQRI